MKELTSLVTEGIDLDEGMVRSSVEELLSPTPSWEEKADFLSALHTKGETPEEIAQFVLCLLEYATSPNIPENSLRGPLLDVCGTGGDRAGLFNISTAAMFVSAACGASVVKHGNRGITSKSGGADVLEALGVPLQVPPEAAGDFLADCGFVFLFAPQYHPAFKAIAPVRKVLAEKGQPSVFNILGPLLNPARPDHQFAGVFHPSLLETYGKVFLLLGRKSAWAVHGRIPGGGIDELSLVGPSDVVVLETGKLSKKTVSPGDARFSPCDLNELRGGDAAENAGIIRSILSGTERGPKRNLVILNAAGACCAAGLAADLAEGAKKASEALDSKACMELLERAAKWK